MRWTRGHQRDGRGAQAPRSALLQAPRQRLGAVNGLGGARSAPGFTLLELAFVIALFGILALFIASRESTLLQTRFDTARQKQVIADANIILDASLAYYNQTASMDWPHIQAAPTQISIEGLTDTMARDPDGNTLNALLANIPINPYRVGRSTAPMVPGITALDDMEYMLGGGTFLRLPETMRDLANMYTVTTGRMTPTLVLYFWVASDGPGEARFIAASLPYGGVVEEHEDGGEIFSKVQTAIKKPNYHGFLRKEWPRQISNRVTFDDRDAKFAYDQPDDTDANPNVQIQFGEAGGMDFFKLVRLKMDGTSETGVEINFDDLTVPGDLTVEGNLMGNFDFEFMDGIELGGKKLTRETFCRRAIANDYIYREVLNAIGKSGWQGYGTHDFCFWWM